MMRVLLLSLILFPTVGTTSHIKRDTSDSNSGEDAGLGSLLSQIVGELAEDLEDAEEAMENEFNSLIGEADPNNLPQNYDNSTSQITKLNNSVSVETNSSVHRENKDGVEETVLKKTQVMKDNNNKVIGTESDVVIDILSSEEERNSQEEKTTGREKPKSRERNQEKDVFKHL